MLLNPELMIRVRHKRPFFSTALKIGVLLQTFHSDWRYGYNIIYRAGRYRRTRFVGRVVDGIPSVFENMFYVSLNFGFCVNGL
jgi:hypothetical protein